MKNGEIPPSRPRGAGSAEPRGIARVLAEPFPARVRAGCVSVRHGGRSFRLVRGSTHTARRPARRGCAVRRFGPSARRPALLARIGVGIGTLSCVESRCSSTTAARVSFGEPAPLASCALPRTWRSRAPRTNDRGRRTFFGTAVEPADSDRQHPAQSLRGQPEAAGPLGAGAGLAGVSSHSRRRGLARGIRATGARRRRSCGTVAPVGGGWQVAAAGRPLRLGHHRRGRVCPHCRVEIAPWGGSRSTAMHCMEQIAQPSTFGK